MWLPPAMLPGAGTTIEPVDEERFSVLATGSSESAPIIMRVDGDGRLLETSLPRYGNQTPGLRYQYIPFGGLIDEEATFGGYTMPSRIRAGWWYDTNRYEESLRFRVTYAQPQ